MPILSFFKEPFILIYIKCGSVPFAHVAKAWISEDQSLPSNLSAKLMRRDGTTPTVHALSLNTNFSQAADST